MAKLNVSNAKNLTTLRCTMAELTKLDVSKNKKLLMLQCAGNSFTKDTKAKLVKWGQIEGHHIDSI